MSSIQNLRFQKYDLYQNPIFIASGDREAESLNFNELKTIYDKLVQKDFGTFLPIFHSDIYNYVTIRGNKNLNHPKLLVNATYDIKYMLRTVEKDGKTYVNVHISKFKLVKKAPRMDMGVELEL